MNVCSNVYLISNWRAKLQNWRLWFFHTTMFVFIYFLKVFYGTFETTSSGRSFDVCRTKWNFQQFGWTVLRKFWPFQIFKNCTKITLSVKEYSNPINSNVVLHVDNKKYTAWSIQCLGWPCYMLFLTRYITLFHVTHNIWDNLWHRSAIHSVKSW